MTSNPALESPMEPQGGRFDWRYWTCIWVEALERLAYYTVRPVAAIYIMQADDPGGLHLTALQKGTIFFWWAVVQSLLPTFTGGLADRYGYRKTLVLSLVMNTLGYLIMAGYHGYGGFMTGVIVLAGGTAFFKPALQGTLAHTVTKETASVGWSIFYFIVNVGSFIGHMITPVLLGPVALRTALNWRYVFIACAAFSFVNLISLVRFPSIPSGAPQDESLFAVMRRTIVNVFEPRLMAFLLIMSCFWMMMYQLWDLQPNFIEDWVNSEPVAKHSPIKAWVETGPDGRMRVQQQVLLSLNSIMIVLFVVPVGWMVRKMRTVSAMFFGMLGATGGVLVAGLTQNGWFLLLGIVLFSLGEMLTGPKKSEYLGLIAPHGKKGLYLGYVNIPTGLGQGLGNLLAGWVYGQFGEKATLALRYMAENKLVPLKGEWNGRVSALSEVTGVSRTEAFVKLQGLLGKSGTEVTQILWDKYDPQYYVWLPFAAIGIFAAIALAIFGQMAKRWKDMNA